MPAGGCSMATSGGRFIGSSGSGVSLEEGIGCPTIPRRVGAAGRGAGSSMSVPGM